MKQDKAKQVARDEKLVPSNDRVKIRHNNLRIDPSMTQREETFQVTLDILKNTPFYNAFLISANVPEIYMQQFWLTIEKVKKSSSYQCLSRKTLSNDRLRPSRIEILWSMYHEAKVDYAAMMWEDLQYQIDNRQTKVRRREIMPYLRIGVIMEYLVKVSKRRAFWSLNEDILKITILKTNTPYPSRKMRHIRACTHQRPQMKLVQYVMYFKYSTGLIPPKKSKEEELEHRKTGRKKRTPRVVVIQEPLSVLVKQAQESSGKLKGIELLSDAAQFEIETQKALKASRRESRFQHQTGVSSEGAGLRPEVSNELTRKSANSDEGADTSPKVQDESEDKSKPRNELYDWGSTNEEEYLLAYKGEKHEDIPWKFTDEDESDNDEEDESDDDNDDEEEDDKSIDIEKTCDERTDTNKKDTIMGKTEKIVEQKADEEHETNKEIKGDENVRDEQVVVLVSTPQKERPSLL
ncbi:hypothetical protein Tco_1401705 [Tanacetum coccineum]